MRPLANSLPVAKAPASAVCKGTSSAGFDLALY